MPRSPIPLLLAGLAVACGDGVDVDDILDPSESIFGDYALETVNGQSVPFISLILSNSQGTITDTIWFESGSFRLNDDETWSCRHTSKKSRNGNVTNTTDTQRGTFITSGGSFQFTLEPGLPPLQGFGLPGDFTGSLSGNTLTILITRPWPNPDDTRVYAR